MIAAGLVSVNGEVVTHRSQRVTVGDLVDYEVPSQAAAGVLGDAGIDVVVVHDDDAVVVVDKPAGLVVHPGAGHGEGTLVNGLLARYPELAVVGDPQRPGIVHRLDRGTSGLLVIARNSEAYAGLVAQMQARTVLRRYVALVWGEMDDRAGIIDAPVGRSRRRPTRMAVTTDGREARTIYEVSEVYEKPATLSMLDCRIETGRTHQIRVHLSAIGHSVVGDEQYGGCRKPIDLDRPFLHAAQLGFDHPISGEAMRFESPLPPELQAVVEGLTVR